MGIPAQLAVVGMVRSGFTIADANDAGMLDIVGMSTDTPHLISNFVGDKPLWSPTTVQWQQEYF